MDKYKRRKHSQYVWNTWLGEPGSKRKPVKVSHKLFRALGKINWYSKTIKQMMKKLMERPADYWVKENQRRLELYKSGRQNYEEYEINMKANLGFRFTDLEKNGFPKV